MSAPETESAAELMSAYLDAELGERESQAFEDYLEQDPRAQQEVAELRQIMALVGGLPRVAAPDGFADQVQRRLKRQRLLREPGAAATLVSLPFQVLSIVVILAIATLYMMAQLDREPAGELRRGEPADPGAELRPKSTPADPD